MPIHTTTSGLRAWVETGEVRQPRFDEWYRTERGAVVRCSSNGDTFRKYPILRPITTAIVADPGEELAAVVQHLPSDEGATHWLGRSQNGCTHYYQPDFDELRRQNGSRQRPETYSDFVSWVRITPLAPDPREAARERAMRAAIDVGVVQAVYESTVRRIVGAYEAALARKDA